MKYRRIIGDYSADVGRSSIGWLKLLVFVALSSLPLAFIPTVFGTHVLVGSVLTLVAMFAIMLKDAILTYNTITHNYVLIYSTTEEYCENECKTKSKTAKIEYEAFERYVSRHKPYLNPDLSITDLALQLGTNRTYLSTFINNQYGMNFSCYINRRRLKELDCIRRLPEHAHIDGIELVLKAGFSTYRGYRNFKLKEDKRSMATIEG